MKKAVLLLAAVMSVYSCVSMQSVKSDRREIVVRTAKNMLGKTYRYGSQDKHVGFDCSGLVQYSYREAGIRIPRTARAQYTGAAKIDKNEMKPGDLVFFSTKGKGATHVGIYLGGGKFIHSPSPGKKVQIVSMSNPYWKKNYYGSGRYINN